MFSLKKLLVPIDFSERSTAAAEHAAAMAARFDSELIFQHVVPPGPYEHGFVEGGYNVGSVWPSRDEMEERLLEQMQELIAKTARGRDVEPVISWGDPIAEIERMAEREQVDLIMMPTHGYGPFRRFALGSVTTKVLHDLNFPIFTGAHVEELPESADTPYEVVVCAIDLQPHSEEVLRWAWGFTQAWNADMIVVHASPSVDGIPTEGRSAPAGLRESVNREKTSEIEGMLAKIGASAARIDVDCADAVRYVLESAKASVADALIIGRSADDSLLGRLRADSAALIREAPCPVISI
jgi:nucleotide-binding universal stress UspA family protein